MNVPVLLTSDTNIFYIAGFTSSNAAVILEGNQVTIVTDFRYEQAARKTGFLVILLEQGKQLTDAVLDYLIGKGYRQVYFEARDMRAEMYLRISSQLELLPVDGEFSKVRSIKEQREIDLMQQAADIATDALQEVQSILAPGVSEREIAAELDFRMRKKGAEEPSFDTIVAFGANASMPHYVPGDVALQRGECVLIDMGARYRGYCSDMTRTWFCGESEMTQIYEIVLQAQKLALEALKAGVPCKEMDAVARNFISQQGYGPQFGHGLGHGVGVDIHEYPTLNPKSDQVLEKNMVVTVEPGIYLPGKGGVRIEDMCLVTQKGHRNFTSASKELIIF